MIHIFLWVLTVLVVLCAVGATYQSIATRRDERIHPPPGRLIDVGGFRLHVLEAGTARAGVPTVILEAGLMSTVMSWGALQRRLAEKYRVVSYDRAGLGWSDLGPMPRTADRITDELHRLLERAGIAPPYVLVGHSFGGLMAPNFAAHCPDDVVGLVLVDAVAAAEWNPPNEHDAKLSEIGAKVCKRAAILSHLGVIRFIAFLLTTGAKVFAGRLVRLISRGTPDDAGTVSSPWFAALPPEEQKMAAKFWVQPKFPLTIASQLENLPVSAASVGAHPIFCEGPVVILSARTSSDRRRAEHAAMAARLPMGEHIDVDGSNHWIMQQQPEIVLDAIDRVVAHGNKTAAARTI
ncbi:MAG: alpha/beta hydrolase [Candidatus Acidiferrales bacterium]